MMDFYRSYGAIVNLFLVLSVYIHTVTCYTLYLSQVSCTVARGNPPFLCKISSNTLLKIQVDILTICISLD